MEDQYKDKKDDKDISEAYKVLKDKWMRDAMEADMQKDDEMIEKEEEILSLGQDLYTLKAKLKIKNQMIEDLKHQISIAVDTSRDDYKKYLMKLDEIAQLKNKNVIEVKKYSNSDKRYENIMSHMDILWHAGEHGPDGCEKCESYRDIMMSAFDKIESMSSRNINLDFATTHVKYGKTVDNNNNHIYRDALTGKIEGGDKDLSEFEDNCKT
tara:strand:+ start:16413 stop:17045 length:633 start_codon:yes stop_codon:yes gene_type:complete